MDKLEIPPFKIHIPDIDVADLSERIKRTRWPDEYQNSNWATGTDKTYLKALLEYWASGYDWRAQEAKLNFLTQFVASIGNNAIHFVHARSQVPGALPIIITHGWPGSFVIVQMQTPKSRFDANWAIRGIKFGKADREQSTKVLEAIVERLQSGYNLSEDQPVKK